MGQVDLNAWPDVLQFADVTSKITGQISRASVLAAFNSLQNYSTHGLTPTLSYTTPNPVASFARVFNPTAIVLQYAGNGVVSDVQPSTFINFFTGAQVPPSP